MFPGPPWTFVARTDHLWKCLGSISFDLTLGELTEPIESFVVPSLDPDEILLSNSILSSFQALLDWNPQTLSFKDSSCILSATFRCHCRSTPTCSRIALVDDATPVEVYVHARTYLVAKSETLVQVRSHITPSCSCFSLVEPRVIVDPNSLDFRDSPFVNESVWTALLDGPFTTWQAADGSGIVQLCN